MKFIQHYSSSSGNLFEVVSNNGERLLIEAGIAWPKMQKALEYNLLDISGCLLSHLHFDHCKAAKDVMAAGIDVYASIETLESLGLSEHHRAKELTPRGWEQIGCFEVLPFETHHDCPGSFGFIIKADGESLLFCTDTSHIDYTFKTAFNIIMLECSYNTEYLQKRVKEKTINAEVAKRLLTSHMSEDECLRTLKNFINLEKCTELHLLHLSADNTNKDRIKKMIKKELFLEAITA